MLAPARIYVEFSFLNPNMEVKKLCTEFVSTKAIQSTIDEAQGPCEFSRPCTENALVKVMEMFGFMCGIDFSAIPIKTDLPRTEPTFRDIVGLALALPEDNIGKYWAILNS